MQLSRRFDGKKFMWDGRAYPREREAREAVEKYRTEGFFAELVPEDGQFYVFTRREVKAVVEGQP